MSRAAEQALGADSPSAGFFGKLRGRAAQAQRSAAFEGVRRAENEVS